MNTNVTTETKQQSEAVGAVLGMNLTDNVSTLGGKAGRICEELERRLSRGVYRFGESISTVQLVDEFNASRAPVTTALNHLRSAGYLIITPQVGCRIVSPSKQEIEDFFHLFGKAEGFMAGLAAERHVDGEVEILADISRHIRKETPKAPKKNERLPDVFLDLVSLFHATIRSMARSPMESRRVASQWRMSEFLLFNGTSKIFKNLPQANRERDEIVEAIRRRDVDGAEKAMEIHVRGKPVRSGTLN